MAFKHPFKVGFSFGLTSGVITTLGIIVGLNSGTHSKAAVIGGILTLAIADSFSDALGIHFSEESEVKHNPKEIWQATFSTFLAKFFFTSIFVVPFIFFDLATAVITSLILGFSILTAMCYKMAKDEDKKFLELAGSHLSLVFVVIFLVNYLGNLINRIFRGGL